MEETTMATSRKQLRAELRETYVTKFMELIAGLGEDVLRTKSNEIAFPVVDAEGNEDFIVVTIKVPTGSNGGLEVYDGYAEAESYKINLEQKEAKAKKVAEVKAKKIAADRVRREKQALLKEKREARVAAKESKSEN